MILEVLAVLVIPTAELLGGRLAAAQRPCPPLPVAAALGALAPAAVVALCQRSFVE